MASEMISLEEMQANFAGSRQLIQMTLIFNRLADMQWHAFYAVLQNSKSI